MPTYGYMRSDEFYPRMIDGDLINDWVIPALKGLIYTDRKGRGAGVESPICQIPWGNVEHTCACRWRMRFSRWVRYKECQWGELAELQMDKVALQRWIWIDGNSQEACEGERKAHIVKLLGHIDSRWGFGRTEDADTNKKPCRTIKNGEQ